MIAIIILGMFSLQTVSSQTNVWHRLNDALYLVNNLTRLEYNEARVFCQEHESDLARVDSDEIQEFLTTFITPPLSSLRCFWIGCNDREVEGTFRWLDGSEVKYDGWAPSQPDDSGGNQDCACLWSARNVNRHGRWDDDNCESNRNWICQKGVYSFSQHSVRSNPGIAYVSCAIDIIDDDDTLSPDDVILSVGRSLSTSRSIPYSSTSLDKGFRNNSFVISNITDADRFFCHVGPMKISRSFSLLRLRQIDFYELPALTSGPAIKDISSTFATLSWSIWIPCLDSGEGPIVGYVVYLQSRGSAWREYGGLDSAEVGGELKRTMEFVLTGLEEGTEYNVSVSAVREGIGGEGPRSPHISFTTHPLGKVLGESMIAWILFGASLAGNIILIIVLMLCYRRRTSAPFSGTRAPPAKIKKDHDSVADHYEEPRPPGDGDAHIYEGLNIEDSGNNEYMSMDNRKDGVEYVNVSSPAIT